MFRATDDLPMATLMTMENDTQSPTLQAGSEFLSAYSERLFSSGSTCIRLEKNVGRIARAWGMDVDISILPHHLHITVHDAGRTDAVTTVTTIQPRAVSFATITCLSSLSWDIADGHVDFGEALSRFNALPDTVGGNWSVAGAFVSECGQCLVLPVVWRRHDCDGDSVSRNHGRLRIEADDA